MIMSPRSGRQSGRFRSSDAMKYTTPALAFTLSPAFAGSESSS
jgi:hypothetical protein